MDDRPGAKMWGREDAQCVAPEELVSLPPLLDGSEGRHPLVVLDLDQAWGEVGDVIQAVRSSDRILVGVSRGGADLGGEIAGQLLNALDLTLVPQGSDVADRVEVVGVADVPAMRRALAEAIGTSPGASVLLTHLLRWSVGVSVEAALDAESLAYSALLGGPEFRAWLGGRGSRDLPPVVAEPVLVERSGDELAITLNRPERRNAYGRQLRDALVSALAVAEADPSVTTVRLSGAGLAFCAGGDLDEFGTTPDPVTAHLVRTRGGAALPLHRLAARTHVHLHGACVGAGIELPAYADHVVAARDAWMRLPEIGMGLIPGAGGTVSIPRRIGRWRTLYMALTDAVVPAEQALAWGLVDGID